MPCKPFQQQHPTNIPTTLTNHEDVQSAHLTQMETPKVVLVELIRENHNPTKIHSFEAFSKLLFLLVPPLLSIERSNFTDVVDFFGVYKVIPVVRTISEAVCETNRNLGLDECAPFMTQ